MSTNQTEQIINKLLSNKKDTQWVEAVDYRELNSKWLKKSAKIAIKLNRVLRDRKMTQKNLASKLGVSTQQVNKILKGRENLTIETISKLEVALKIELISIISQEEIKDMIAKEVFEHHKLWKKTNEYDRKREASYAHEAHTQEEDAHFQLFAA